MTGVLSRAGAAWLLAALTGALVVAAALSLGAVFDAPPAAWLPPSSVPAVLGLAGAATVRSLGGRVLRPLLVGLAVAAGAWCLQWWPETLLAGLLPQQETAGAIAASAAELRETIWTDTVPVTPTDPALAAVGAVLALTALVTDAIAVGLRSPAIAGIPPLALIGGAAVITAGVTPWPALAIAAGAWLALLAVGSDSLLSLIHEAPAPGARPESDRPAGGASWPAGTVATGAAAVAALVAGATQVPFLATGLAPEGQRFVLGQGAGPVNPAADLGRELRSSTGYAGIRYETEDGRGVYLRTAVVEDVQDSPWEAVPPQYSGPPTITGFDPAGARLAGGSDRLLAQAAAGGDGPWSVVSLSLDDWSGNWAPLPDQVWRVDRVVGDWGWQVEPSTSVAYRRESTPVELDYRAAVVPVRMGLEELASLTRPGAPQGIYNRWGSGPELEGSRVEALAQEVTAGMTNPVEQAAAIQAHLTSGRFTYSETAPVERGYDGSGLRMTEQFLEAGAGYCIHYASAMTMMAQSVGIPARVVVGYAPVAATPGTGTQHRVTSDRAHSWPELYLNGVGWVPFEPTPGVGRTPSYTQAQGSGDPTPEADPRLPGTAASPNAPLPASGSGGEGAGSAGRDGAARVDRTVGSMVLGLTLAAALAGLAVLPRWLRARRRRRRLGARTGQVQGPAPGAIDGPDPAADARRMRRRVRDAWQELEDTATDLGLGRRAYEPEPAFAHRLAGRSTRDGARPDGRSGAAATATVAAVDKEVEAIVDAISWARYAPDASPAPTTVPGTVGRVRALVTALEQAADPAIRRRARWLPASLLPAPGRPGSPARPDWPGWLDWTRERNGRG
ncbi:transglutaminaseTgpA domain-containing protein [Citricoccus sp.]|uniref:transglutaminase family protein n=1 Tax=Citricoccus sp. TaxID=1978372 RepID=UPI002C9DB7A2|nr:transglutaminaseTgpA domain-containing protein [Citricoccus sp.]HRO92580.1 transglutaminaseTgpA domain-containing protein [Citricoccus sp.]